MTQDNIAPPKLQINGLGKMYGDITALEPSHLQVSAGEFLTLLGPSGSGKTTLLQMISGLVEPTSGTLLVDGKDHTFTPVNRRNMGMVFQHYALFPHMTVRENIAFPLKMRRIGKDDVAQKVEETLQKVQLTSYAERFPRELSGGQQQRVALARCFVYQPEIILMDEPLGALDKNLREDMQLEIRRLHREFGSTVIYVTHDQEEALVLSDRICLMNHAKIEQLGTPEQIYSQPETVFSARFLGMSNILSGIVETIENTVMQVKNNDGTFKVPARANLKKGDLVNIIIRPENLRSGKAGNGENTLSLKVNETVYVGSLTRLLGTTQSGEKIIAFHNDALPLPQVGDIISCHWAIEKTVAVS